MLLRHGGQRRSLAELKRGLPGKKDCLVMLSCADQGPDAVRKHLLFREDREAESNPPLSGRVKNSSTHSLGFFLGGGPCRGQRDRFMTGRAPPDCS